MKIKRQLHNLIVIIIICLIGHSVECQSSNYYGNGTYQFESYFPEWDLHFWLFDDGYHSFSHSPSNQYGNYAIIGNPLLYHTTPYNDDTNVDDIAAGIITNGVTDPNAEILEFQNQIEIKRSWNCVNSEDNFFILMFENNQYSQPISGCVEFHFNINHTSIVPGNILDDFNNDWVESINYDVSDYINDGYFTNKFVWEYHGLKEGEQRFIYIPADCLAQSMESVYSRGVMKINECNVIFEDNSKTDGSIDGIINGPIYTLRSVVSNFPHDPNYILSDPNCFEGEAGVLSQTFRYRLHFQNEGIDPSLNVITNFYSNIEFGSVTLVSSSFDSYLSWDTHGIYAGFNNINLRGLYEEPAPHYDHTKGWIEIDVCYNLEDYYEDLPDCIELEAHVLFDGQLPIVANNSICYEHHCGNENVLSGTCQPTPYSQGYIHGGEGYKTTSITEESLDSGISIYPNPAFDYIFVNSKESEEELKIIVSNIFGERLLNNENYNLENSRLDISKLTPGVYFVNYIENGLPQSKSFVKY